MSETEDQHEVKLLPHARGSEKIVLAAIIHEPERMEESAILPDMFYLPAHRIIFEDIAATKGTWELVSAAQRLHDKGLLDSVGGPSNLAEVNSYHRAGVRFDVHLATLRDRMARRMAIKAAHEAAAAAYDCSGESDYLASLSAPVTAVFDAASSAVLTKGMKTLAADFMAEFEDKVRGRKIEPGIPTGISEIDRHLHGMKPQHMGIISGRSGAGKSTLATQIFGGLKDALYLILERTESSAFSRCVVQVSKLHHEAIYSPNGLRREVLIHVRQSVHRLTESNLHIVKPSNRKLATICAEIRRHVRLHGIKVAFLDQIGLVRGERIKGDTGEAELRGISNTVQELAHELGIHVVVLCQETAEGETKNARAIEEDADWWASIVQERDKKKENFGEHQHVLIAKDSHHGSAGERLPLILDKETLRFVHGFPKAKAEPVKKSRFNN